MTGDKFARWERDYRHANAIQTANQGVIMNTKRMLGGLAAAGLAAALFFGAADAGEYADQCTARLEADGRDPSGCACLEEHITSDPALAEEFTQLATIEDPAARYAAASDGAKAAMDHCTRS